MQSLRLAHGSITPASLWAATVDNETPKRRDATASVRTAGKEMLGSIYSIIAHGNALPTPPKISRVDEDFSGKGDVKPAGRAFAKELLKSIYSALGEKRAGCESCSPQLLGSGEGKPFGFKMGQIVHWARRDEAFGQRGKVVGYSDDFEEPAVLVEFRGFQYHCQQ